MLIFNGKTFLELDCLTQKTRLTDNLAVFPNRRAFRQDGLNLRLFSHDGENEIADKSGG